MSILLVCGSRWIHDQKFIEKCLLETMELYDFDTVIQGGADGVDKIAYQLSKFWGRNTRTYHPAWNKYGKIAGVMRNTAMVNVCDKGIAIWDGKSKGTADTIRKLEKANKLLKVFIYE